MQSHFSNNQEYNLEWCEFTLAVTRNETAWIHVSYRESVKRGNACWCWFVTRANGAQVTRFSYCYLDWERIQIRQCLVDDDDEVSNWQMSLRQGWIVGLRIDVWLARQTSVEVRISGSKHWWSLDELLTHCGDLGQVSLLFEQRRSV